MFKQAIHDVFSHGAHWGTQELLSAARIRD